MNDELRAHLAQVVESSDDAIVSKTLEGRITSWNSAAERLFGYRADEIVGRHITTIIPDELEHEEDEIISRIRKGQRVEHYETRRRAKDGRSLDVSISVSPIRDAQGTIIGAAKIARDIGAWKRAEAALREEAEALDTLNRVARVVAAELDLERLVDVVTRAATQLSGAAFGAFFDSSSQGGEAACNPYSLAGAPREAFSSFPLPTNTELFGITFRGEGTVRSDDVTRDPRYGRNPPHRGMPEGHLPVRSYLAVPVTSRLGEVLGGLFLGHPDAGVFTDRAERLVEGIAAQAAIGIDNARLYRSAQREIAERRRMEQALRQSEQVYRAIGESIDYGIWVCDPSGRNVFASESFLNLVGISQKECSEYGWSRVLHPDEVESTLEGWRECVRSGAKWDREHRFLGVDGRYHTVLARGVPVRDEDGEISCWVGINLDIERLKQAEQTLREADRRKDEFLAILAHELRNPLAPIRYALALTRETATSEEQRRRANEVIERQVEHLTRLLEDLLDVARISHGRLDLREETLDLAAVLTSALEVARPALESRRHALELSLPREPLAIFGDGVRLGQVFANLLINAAKYTPPGGHVVLDARREAGRAVVAVRDDGMGISDAMRERLFGLFSRSTPPLERAEGGLGIGLALARSIVELHSGSIEARSEGVGKGSEFVVSLPLAAGAPDAPKPTSRAGAAPVRLRLLVADDHPDGLQLSADLLGAWGHEVAQARGGREALELGASFRPEVALLDIGMPDMDGYDLARRVRERDWGASVVLVALTGWGRPDDKRLAFEAGFDHHLTKPVDPSQLSELLASLARARRELET